MTSFQIVRRLSIWRCTFSAPRNDAADLSIQRREQLFDRILPRHHVLVERELRDRLKGLAVLLDAERERIADHRGIDGCRPVPRGDLVPLHVLRYSALAVSNARVSSPA